MGFVASTRFCRESGFVANTRFFGLVLSRLLLRHKGFYSDFVQISAQKIGRWDLWSIRWKWSEKLTLTGGRPWSPGCAAWEAWRASATSCSASTTSSTPPSTSSTAALAPGRFWRISLLCWMSRTLPSQPIEHPLQGSLGDRRDLLPPCPPPSLHLQLLLWLWHKGGEGYFNDKDADPLHQGSGLIAINKIEDSEVFWVWPMCCRLLVLAILILGRGRGRCRWRTQWWEESRKYWFCSFLT